MNVHESYRDRQLAHFYDLEYRDYTEDLDFYVQHALAMDSGQGLLILELGCGTGRIAIALAEAGFRVVGVDSSEGMLDLCARRAQERGVRDNLTPVRADMRGLRDVPMAPFNMALCALNTFAYLSSTEDQLAMLRAVHPLLVQHGLLLLDLTPPLPHLLPPAGGELIHQGSYQDDKTGAAVHKFVTGTAHPATQSHRTRLIYDLEEKDTSLRRVTQEMNLRWTGRYEMELLLKTAGYRLEKLYGSYELDDYGDNSERMIFVART
jgi:ubiquinone/menaquinone biosynthesis C-methylase UbiE